MNGIQQKSKKNPRILIVLSFILLVLAPLSNSGNQASSFRDVIPAFLFLILACFVYKVKIYLKAYYSLLFIFYMWALLSSFFAGVVFDRTVITFLLFIILFIITDSVKLNERESKSIIYAYMFLGFLASFLVIVSFLLNKSYSYSRYSLDCIGIYKNPNYVVGFSMGSFSLIVYFLLFTKKSFRKTVLSLFGIVTIWISFFFSGTRAAVLAACIITVVGVLLYWYKNIKKIWTLLVIVVLCVLIVVGYKYILSFLPDFLKSRLALSNFSGEGDIRIVLWQGSFEHFWSTNPISGLGINGTDNYSQSIYNLSLHNVPLQLIFDMGFVGAFIVFLFLLQLYRKKQQNPIFMLMISLGLVIPIMFQNGLYAMTFWFPILLFNLICNMDYKFS